MIDSGERLIWLASVMSVLVAYPGWTQPISHDAAEAIEVTETKIPRLDQLEPSATTVDEWLAQVSPTVVQVTEVRLNPLADGIEMILETTGELTPNAPNIVGNALITEIPNASLAGEAFRQSNPVAGIALVEVTNLPGNRVRLAVTGTMAPPTAAVRTEAQQVTFSIAAQTSGSAEAPDDALQVVVTGEQASGYAVDRATTVTRTDTPLRDIPRSIQVIPQQVLEDQAIVRVGDATRNVSGVVRDGGFGGTIDQFNIRGFFTTDVLENGLRSQAGTGFAETANIERIEVLKGPASILLGNVEPGGIINVITEQPQEEPTYEIGLQAGSYTFVRPTLDFTGPLTNDRRLLYRLNLAYEYSDGFRDFDQDVDRLFIAPVLTWRLSDATTLTFDFTHLRDDRPFDRGIVAIGDQVADIPITRILGEPNDIRSVRSTSAGYRLEHRFNENWTLRNRFQFFSSDDFDFRAEPLELNEAGGILSRNFRSNDDYTEVYNLQTDVVGQFATGSIAHNLLVGVDLRRQTFGGTQRRLPDGLTPDINIFDPDYDVIDRPGFDDLTNEVRNSNDRTDALGILVQDLVEITDNLKLLLAGRFDVVEQSSIDNLAGSVASDRSDDAFSPTVGLVYQPIEPISLYANYARSFQPNFGTRADGSFLQPERGTQYEIGIRAEFGRNLIASLAAYHLTKTNVATTDPDNPDFSIAIGEQRSQGIEFDIGGEILPGWNLIASYGLIDAEVIESNDVPEGRVDGVPRNTASLWTTYEIQAGDLEGLGVGLGLFYVDERLQDGGSYTLSGYLRTDASLFYRRDNWRAAINVQNLFDQRYFETANFGRLTIMPGAPLTVVASLTVEF